MTFVTYAYLQTFLRLRGIADRSLVELDFSLQTFMVFTRKVLVTTAADDIVLCFRTIHMK